MSDEGSLGARGGGAGGRVRRVAGRLLPDFGAARENAPFRRLLVGGMLSNLGGSMTAFAITLQVWDMTRSSFAVGAIGFTCVPIVLAGLIGGSIADHVDPRRLALAGTIISCVLSTLLAIQAFADWRQLWLLYLLVAVQSVVGAVAAPARRTFVPRLLPKDRLRAGIALQTLTGRITMLAGPALAGVITGAWGLKMCYAIDAVSFTASFYSTIRLPSMLAAVPAAGAASRRTLRSVAEGLRYIRHTPVIAAALLTDLNCMLFGLPVALFPALNAEHFGGRPQTLGLLTTAIGVGGIITAVLSGPASRFTRHGWGMLGGTMIWGLAIALFGLSRSLPLALLMLATAGAADTLTVTFRSSMIQTVTPDQLRGRVSSVEYLIGASAGGGLGNVESGTVAALTSPVFSAVSGGVACLAAAALIAVAFPVFRRYDARHAEAPRPTVTVASPS
jgi:MFS family permease